MLVGITYTPMASRNKPENPWNPTITPPCIMNEKLVSVSITEPIGP